METRREEMKKRSDALYAAFEGDGFDAKKLELGPPMSKKMSDATDRHVQVLSQLIAILKPEQRDKLAARMDRPGPGRVGYPVDDESGVGYFFNEAQRPNEDTAPPKP